ncbi:putative lipoprotein [Burkholderia anthina]|uniref:Putative lipoprotein n=1 Tax=Burkholderia anthina TaxID=179879 RepID=A0A6P2G8C8_9BURK|nr:putative lipoprotein [Burkholderia anthina]
MNRKTRTLLGAAVIAGSALLAGCQTGATATDAAEAADARAARPADGRPVTKTVYVAPRPVRCTGVAPMDCL